MYFGMRSRAEQVKFRGVDFELNYRKLKQVTNSYSYRKEQQNPEKCLKTKVKHFNTFSILFVLVIVKLEFQLKAGIIVGNLICQVAMYVLY